MLKHKHDYVGRLIPALLLFLLSYAFNFSLTISRINMLIGLPVFSLSFSNSFQVSTSKFIWWFLSSMLTPLHTLPYKRMYRSYTYNLYISLVSHSYNPMREKIPKFYCFIVKSHNS